MCDDNTKGIRSPIYPRKSVGGCITNKAFCKMGFNPNP